MQTTVFLTNVAIGFDKCLTLLLPLVYIGYAIVLALNDQNFQSILLLIVTTMFIDIQSIKRKLDA